MSIRTYFITLCSVTSCSVKIGIFHHYHIIPLDYLLNLGKFQTLCKCPAKSLECNGLNLKSYLKFKIVQIVNRARTEVLQQLFVKTPTFSFPNRSLFDLCKNCNMLCYRPALDFTYQTSKWSSRSNQRTLRQLFLFLVQLFFRCQGY